MKRARLALVVVGVVFSFVGIRVVCTAESTPLDLTPGESPGAKYGRPNIVFLYTDDQAPWALGLSGNPEARTPNLDRLFREGAYLVNCFTTTPVCSPSRAGLIASRYGTELGITDFLHPRKEPELGLEPAVVTWPEVLAAAGYTNGLFGKWHLGLPDRYHPTRVGYHQFIGFRGGGNRPKDPILEIDGKEQRLQGLLPDILTDHAIAFVHQNQEKPFLLSLHYRAPHAPWLPVADEDWAPFKDLDPTIPHPDYPDLDVARVKRMMREYLASVASVDRNVGRLLDVLDKLKLTQKTVVIFTSDHGYNMGHNGIWHKGNGHWVLKSLRGLPGNDPRVQRPNLYDNSLRVPTAVRWPGVIKPGTVEETISNLDWYPTILAMTGVSLPDDTTIRGRDFLPLLKGGTMDWDNDLYAEYSQHHYVEADLRMYRTAQWKLIRDFNNPGKDELYHLAKDPGETTNLIDSADPEVRRVKRSLKAKLLAKMQELNDPVLKTRAERGQFLR